MHEQSDSDIMGENIFFKAGSGIYYRASEPAGVFLIRLDVDALQAFEASEHEADEDGELEMTAGEQATLAAAVRIEAVGDGAIEATHAQPIDVGLEPALTRAWLMACADAIEEAGGVPAEVHPPIPASDRLAA